jgi:hypothetical protein
MSHCGLEECDLHCLSAHAAPQPLPGIISLSFQFPSVKGYWPFLRCLRSRGADTGLKGQVIHCGRWALEPLLRL